MRELWTESPAFSVTESDYAGRIRPSALLGAMQNAADRHLEEAGISVGRMLEHGLAWILMTTKLDLNGLPKLGIPIELETWNCGASGVQWTRDYRILGADGAELARASTAWTLVDMARRRILRPSAVPFPLPTSGRPSLAGAPDKAVLPGEDAAWTEAGSYTVPYSAVDCYGHMNNARYADLCMDLLTPEELRTLDLCSLHITYSREAAMGDRLALRRCRLGNELAIGAAGENGRSTFEAVLTFAQSSAASETENERGTVE
ncbi:thioesterase [Saccharibacillus sp. CPCC 101409]|uniref:acyl-[acyl-carrier-protein] thioesterase n=1 Tax=Saccharibacillus sp. CPCC 101409 TaxID=3058041 RepID=UPI002673BF4A|nr:acyl-ACP thioesterase domain-containing protein [Saccharibacillus sp. CPCC 101409]MDO3411702.1 thioesterase [Saccharibacillus sp. CPCC 101409]